MNKIIKTVTGLFHKRRGYVDYDKISFIIPESKEIMK